MKLDLWRQRAAGRKFSRKRFENKELINNSGKNLTRVNVRRAIEKYMKEKKSKGSKSSHQIPRLSRKKITKKNVNGFMIRK